MTFCPPSHSSLLGNYDFRPVLFANLDSLFKEFADPSFKNLTVRKRFKKINQKLLQLIQESPDESFLFPAVIHFIDRVNREGLLERSYRFSHFEAWINCFSDLSHSENQLVRAKIVGKRIPREDYQIFFPVGTGKIFPGSHFVTGHISPDVDTTIASFLGWIDAFGARLAEALHIWSLPGGVPDSHVSMIFRQFFGEGIFAYLPRTSGFLSLSAIDLFTQENVVKAKSQESIATLTYAWSQKAIIYVDQDEHYLGDWHISDVEIVRQVVVLFTAVLRWFETHFHMKLISFFAKEDLNKTDIPSFISMVFDLPIRDCSPVKEFNEQQKSYLNDFLRKVLSLQKGLKSSFSELSRSLDLLKLDGLKNLHESLLSLASSSLFDQESSHLGRLREDRPAIFQYLLETVKALDQAIYSIRNYVDRLDMVMAIKDKVLGIHPQFVTYGSDLEEIQLKMKNRESITVVLPVEGGKFFPLGVIYSHKIQKAILGTVSQRDFCNSEEIKMASYLEVISVIDHHKSDLKTTTTPQVLIADAQSCNVLVAEGLFRINDRYSFGGISNKQLKKQIESCKKQGSWGLIRKLLQKEEAADTRGEFYINPLREMMEYLCCIYAILDDTDLLTKVSNRDVECVVSLLNRLKSLTMGEEIEILKIDDVPRDSNFAKSVARRILCNQDMYSLYKKIYDFKENEFNTGLQNLLTGQSSTIFADTKEQNSCCRVGQTKLFSLNFPRYLEVADLLRKKWVEDSKERYKTHPEIDLYLHMVSTIPSADEVYQDQVGGYPHKDELWFFVPSTQQAFDHLNSFLNAFQGVPQVAVNHMELEFLGPNAIELDQAFTRHFLHIPKKTAKNCNEGLPIAVLRFDAGTINSRKSMITPCLPKLVS